MTDKPVNDDRKVILMSGRRQGKSSWYRLCQATIELKSLEHQYLEKAKEVERLIRVVEGENTSQPLFQKYEFPEV